MKMNIKTFEAEYDLIEFNHYIDKSNDKIIHVLDMVVKTEEIDYIKEELSNIFIVDADKNSYVFSDYELIECYNIGAGLVQIICAK